MPKRDRNVSVEEDALVTKLREELEGLKNELKAMEFVTYQRGQLPVGQEGFARVFGSFVLTDQIKRIDAQIVRVDAKEARLAAKEAVIDAQRTRGDAKTMASAADLLNHCAEKLPECDRGKGSTDAERLSQLVKAFDTKRLEQDIRKSASLVAASIGRLEKEYHPVPVVIGAPGQGKTEVLYWITGRCPNAVDGPTITREEFTAKLKLKDPNRAPTAIDVAPICLFATFNQSSMMVGSELEGKGIEAALTSRLAAWYMQREWSADLTKMTGCSLEALIAEIRKREGERRLVILAIDELRRIGDLQERTELLNVVSALSQTENSGEHPLFPIVSCLDVEGVLSLKSESGRPLLPIKLLPCPTCDMEAVLEKALPNFPSIDEATVRHLIFSTNGHYRSLETLANGQLITAGDPDAFPAQLAVLRMIYQDQAMQPKIKETTELDRFAKHKTLYQCASQAAYGIFYVDVDPENDTVTPQLNMLIVANTMRSGPHNTPLFAFLHSIINKMGKIDAGKEIEQIVPQLLVLRAFLHDAPCSVLDLLSVAIRSDDKVIPPLFTDWQSPASRLCTRHLLMEDLKNTYFTEPPDEEATCDTGVSLIKLTESTGAGVRLAFPRVQNYPAIEGVVFGLLGDANDPTKQYPLAVQMQCYSDGHPSEVVEWANKAHDHVQNKLGFRKREYYVLLCVTNLPSPAPTLPKGTLVVGPEFLEALCRPFGLGSAVLEIIKKKRATTSPATR